MTSLVTWCVEDKCVNKTSVLTKSSQQQKSVLTKIVSTTHPGMCHKGLNSNRKRGVMVVK
jgi:hypothetical protein